MPTHGYEPTREAAVAAYAELASKYAEPFVRPRCFPSGAFGGLLRIVLEGSRDPALTRTRAGFSCRRNQNG
jgi:hypothetical protein